MLKVEVSKPLPKDHRKWWQFLSGAGIRTLKTLGLLLCIRYLSSLLQFPLHHNGMVHQGVLCLGPQHFWVTSMVPLLYFTESWGFQTHKARVRARPAHRAVITHTYAVPKGSPQSSCSILTCVDQSSPVWQCGHVASHGKVLNSFAQQATTEQMLNTDAISKMLLIFRMISTIKIL